MGEDCSRRGKRPVETGNHIGKSERRQDRFPVRKSVSRRETTHRLDQGPKSGILRVGARLAESRNADNDQSRILTQQKVWRKPHRFQCSRPVTFDKDIGRSYDSQKRSLGLLVTQL